MFHTAPYPKECLFGALARDILIAPKCSRAGVGIPIAHRPRVGRRLYRRGAGFYLCKTPGCRPRPLSLFGSIVSRSFKSNTRGLRRSRCGHPAGKPAMCGCDVHVRSRISALARCLWRTNLAKRRGVRRPRAGPRCRSALALPVPVRCAPIEQRSSPGGTLVAIRSDTEIFLWAGRGTREGRGGRL